MYKKEAPFMTSSPRFVAGETGTQEEVGPGKYDKKKYFYNLIIFEIAHY